MNNEETDSKKIENQNQIPQKNGTSNNNYDINSKPIKKKKKKKPYDLSQFEIKEQIQETFIETIPIKVRKQDPSYMELKNVKITIGVPPGGEDDDNQNKRRRPLRNRRNIANIDTANKIGEDESDQVLIVVPMDDGTNWVREYDKGEPLQYIVDDFKEDKGENLPENTKLDWKFNEDPLDLNAKIESLVPQLQPTVFLDLEIKQKGLDLNLDDEEEEEELTDVAKPFNNPFEVYSFNKYDKSFQILNFNKEDLENSEIEKYNLSSSFCNGNNHLYISGGDSTNENRFWDVNLKNNSIKTYNLPNKKKNHSMIYVPNKYIFIIGGNDKKVYYFDTETKEIYNWGNLNEIHIEPSLGLYQNKEIYVFSNNDDKLLVEKTDLTSKKPFWKKIEPKLDDDIVKFDQKFSGVSLKKNKFIFLGGDMEKNGNEFNYEYDINKKLVKKSNIKFKKFNLKEKTFLKYNDSLDFVLTDFNKVKPEVLFYKKNKNKFKSFHFNPKILNTQTDTSNNKLKNSQKFNFDMPKYDSYLQTDYAIYFDNDDDNLSCHDYEVNDYNEKINNKNDDEVDIFLNQSMNLQNSKIVKKSKVLKSKKNNKSKLKNSIKESLLKSSKKEINKQPDLNKKKPKLYLPKRIFDNNKYMKPLIIMDNSIVLSTISLNPKQTKLKDNPKQIKLDNNPKQINLVNNDLQINLDNNQKSINLDNNDLQIKLENKSKPIKLDNNESNNIIIDEINPNINQNLEENIIKNSNLKKSDDNKNKEDYKYEGSLLKSSIILNNSIGSQKKSALPIVGDKSSRNKIASSFINDSKNFNKNDIEQRNLGDSINVGMGGKKSE